MNIEGGLSLVEKLGGGCPLQTEADSRRCCYRAGLPGFNWDDRILESEGPNGSINHLR